MRVLVHGRHKTSLPSNKQVHVQADYYRSNSRPFFVPECMQSCVSILASWSVSSRERNIHHPKKDARIIMIAKLFPDVFLYYVFNIVGACYCFFFVVVFATFGL